MMARQGKAGKVAVRPFRYQRWLDKRQALTDTEFDKHWTHVKASTKGEGL